MNICPNLTAMLGVAAAVCTLSTKTHASPNPSSDPLKIADTTKPWRPKKVPYKRRKFHEDLEFGSLGVSAVAQQLSFDDYELTVSDAHADVLRAADLRLTGDGAGFGGVARAGYESKGGFRFGLGVGGKYVEGVSLRHGVLPLGVTAKLASVSAANFQATFGKSFNAGFFYPYIDAKISVNIIVAEVELITPEYGNMGVSSHVVPSASLAPRIGALLPLDSAAFVDLSVEYGLFGVERFGGQLQFGVMLDLR